MAQAHTRFLLVDDDDVDREVLRRFMTKIDGTYELVEAANLAEARMRLDEAPFDCVLLDYHLGGALGLELLPHVVAHRPEVCPVVLVTLRESEALIVEAIRSGVSDYVPKSGLDIERLQCVISGVMARAAAAEQRRIAEQHFQALAENLRLEYEESLKAAAERAELASHAKGRFVANMSHEIRTPLNTVIGIAYLLRRTALDGTQADLVDKIEIASKSLLGIINNVLDSSKLSDSNMDVEHIPVAPHELFVELYKLAEVQIGGRELELGLTIADDVPARILGDPTRLRQIVFNLLTNAIKFTEAGKVAMTVSTRHDENRELRLCIAVSDSGIGIAPEMLDRLFERFTQADNSTTRCYGGSGLGLSISRDLAVLMGGSITAESELNQGTTFTVDLPCEPYDATVEDTHAADEDMPAARRLEGVKILLVDDCDINLDVAARILRTEAAEVTTAVNGQLAVELVLEPGNRFDIVLMDLQMPVLDGYDAFKRIEGLLGEHRPRILALTAAAATFDEEGFDLGGMDGLVPKPFEVDALVRTVHRHIANRIAPVASNDDADLGKTVTRRNGWPSFNRVATDQANLRMGGDEALFRSALERLLDGFRDLAIHAAELDMEQLRGRLHRLKGSSGLVGAMPLHKATCEAEIACSGDDDIAIGRALAAVMEEMEGLRAETANYLRDQAVIHAIVPRAVSASHNAARP